MTGPGQGRAGGFWESRWDPAEFREPPVSGAFAEESQWYRKGADGTQAKRNPVTGEENLRDGEVKGRVRLLRVRPAKPPI